MSKKATIWLLKDGEPLPVDEVSQILRTGRLAQALQKREHEVHWFSGRFDHGRKSFRKAKTSTKIKDNLTLHLLDGKGYQKNISPARILHQRQVSRHFSKLAATLPKPDLILAAYPSPELCQAGKIYAQNQRVPFYVDVRDPWPESFAKSISKLKANLARPLFWYYKNLLKQSLQASDGIISMSQAMLNWSLQQAGRTSKANDKVFYLGCEKPQTLNTSPLRPSPKKITSDHPLTCIFYGMFGSSHNGEVVIQAAKKTAQKKLPVKYIMAGDGDLKPHWESLAKELSNVEFTGWIGKSEAESYLAQSHLGFITIRGEINKFWFGNKFFEYNSFGLALLNDTCGELSSIIKDQSLGKNISPNNSDSIVQAIEQYLTQPEQLQQHMENSQQIFNQHFQAEKIYEDYASFLESCLERNANLVSVD